MLLAYTMSPASIFHYPLALLLFFSFVWVKMGELDHLFPRAGVPSGFLGIQSPLCPGSFLTSFKCLGDGHLEGACPDEHWGLCVSDEFYSRNQSPALCQVPKILMRRIPLGSVPFQV